MLEKSILKTLTYFDLLDFPLTKDEVFRYLLKTEKDQDPVTTEQVEKVLQELVEKGKIDNFDKFYFLPERHEIVQIRNGAERICQRRLQKARNFLLLAKFLPFIRGILVTGSLAGGYSKETSDIDFWVITKKDRIFLGRLFITGLSQILGIRRHGNKITDRICLNYYLTEGSDPIPAYPVCVALDYASMLVALNPGIETHWGNIPWIGENLVNPPERAKVWDKAVKRSRIIQPILEFIIEFLSAEFWEKKAERYQRSRIREGRGILVSKDHLSFHPGDKWASFLARFEALTRTNLNP